MLFVNIARNVNEKVLRLLDERHSLEQQCLLRDDWLQTVVEPGDVAHVSGKFNDDGVCLLSNTAGGEGYLVTQPDTLISTTSVAMATRCMRRFVLSNLLTYCLQVSIHFSLELAEFEAWEGWRVVVEIGEAYPLHNEVSLLCTIPCYDIK